MQHLILMLSLGKKIANLHDFSTVGSVEGLSIVCYSGGSSYEREFAKSFRSFCVKIWSLFVALLQFENTFFALCFSSFTDEIR